MRKLLLFVILCCTCALFAEEEITIKATGEFAKELKELMEKYQTNDVNGSIEIISENAAALTDETADAENEMLENSGEIVVMDVNENIYNEGAKKEEKKDFSLMGALFGKKEINGDIVHGEKLYKQNCIKCHGERAEKSSYLSARDLITLSKEEISDQLKNYKRDSGYGGGSGLIMRVQAVMLNDAQIDDIASYIESLK
ncbi:MAG: c-type cytochrome [Campylobacteraceae bacterium]|jgi:cytochrome c553|nr:c-type cytochrome [Campylobacteraceae bacterium]